MKASYIIEADEERTPHQAFTVSIFLDRKWLGWFSQGSKSLDPWTVLEVGEYVATLGLDPTDAGYLSMVLCDELKERGLIPW